MRIALLPYISFAFSLSGLILQLFAPASRKKVLLVTVITSLAVMTGVAAWNAAAHEREVATAMREIVVALDGNAETFDQIAEALNKPDFRVISEALDRLIEDGKVGHQLLEVRDDHDRHFRTRVYFDAHSPLHGP